MKKSDKKAKTEKAKTTTSALYDCCWYEPSCYDLCCGGVCGCQALQMVLRDQQSSRCEGPYFGELSQIIPPPSLTRMWRGKERNKEIQIKKIPY